MAQYIQSPVLMGAQMADELTKQRTNLVGQGILQATDALNRAAAADAQTIANILLQQERLKAGLDVEGRPVPLKDYKAISTPGYGEQTLKQIQAGQAARAGVNIAAGYGKPGFVIREPMTPVTETPIPVLPGQETLLPAESTGLIGRTKLTPEQWKFLQELRSGVVTPEQIQKFNEFYNRK